MFSSLVLSLILLASLLPPGGTFTDDDGSVHEPNIEAIAAARITVGCDLGLFCPDDPVTRGQMAAFLRRALDGKINLGTPEAFSDITGTTFESDIVWLSAAGITQGCGGGQFCPGASVPRQQMAAFLRRALGDALGVGTPIAFSDIYGTPFEDDIEWLSATGITQGCTTTQFCPLAPVTRAQMASFLTRALGLTPLTPPSGPGNPDGVYPIPPDAQAEDVSTPDTIIGNGTPASCTSAAVIAAVAVGGIITFNCGPDPVTIVMNAPAKIVNNTGPRTVIDGGGRVTLSGGGSTRVLYMNTCDSAQVWTTDHCQNQDHPQLTVQNLTFTDADSSGMDPDGGGAIWVRGGRFKIVNSTFSNNSCESTGPDVGGASVRVFSQYNGLPVYVVNSTFGGGPASGNTCSNAGGISSIGVSWTIINSLFTNNDATGWGANPSQTGTPGGGSGAAIYNDGNTMTLRVLGTRIEDNHANEGGAAIFFVSNDRSGRLIIEDSVLRNNPSDGFGTAGFPGIFYLGSGNPVVANSIITE